jgi:hypothetical protein
MYRIRKGTYERRLIRKCASIGLGIGHGYEKFVSLSCRRQSRYPCRTLQGFNWGRFSLLLWRFRWKTKRLDNSGVVHHRTLGPLTALDSHFPGVQMGGRALAPSFSAKASHMAMDLWRASGLRTCGTVNVQPTLEIQGLPLTTPLEQQGGRLWKATRTVLALLALGASGTARHELI